MNFIYTFLLQNQNFYGDTIFHFLTKEKTSPIALFNISNFNLFFSFPSFFWIDFFEHEIFFSSYNSSFDKKKKFFFDSSWRVCVWKGFSSDPEYSECHAGVEIENRKRKKNKSKYWFSVRIIFPEIRAWVGIKIEIDLIPSSKLLTAFWKTIF